MKKYYIWYFKHQNNLTYSICLEENKISTIQLRFKKSNLEFKIISISIDYFVNTILMDFV